MSAGGLRGGSATTHTYSNIHTHTPLLLSAVIVRPHARCVSAQELTAWEASYKPWDWLHKSYLERVSLLTSLTHAELHTSTVVHSNINTHTYVPMHKMCCRHGRLCPNFKDNSKKPHNCYVFLTFWYFTDQHTQRKKGFFAKSGIMRVWC